MKLDATHGEQCPNGLDCGSGTSAHWHHELTLYIDVSRGWWVLMLQVTTINNASAQLTLLECKASRLRVMGGTG